MGDHGDAAEAEQDRAADRVGVESAAQPAERRAQQQAARRPRSAPTRAASRIASATARAVPSSVFSATLPVKPSVTTTSAAPVSRSRPSTLPTKSIAVGAGERLVRLDHVGPALLLLLADREQGDAGALDPEDAPR